MRKTVWLDLFQPTEQEEIIVDMAFSINLPTHREMQQIEVSRRLYREGDALFMTATVLTKADTHEPASSPVTFIFAENRLVTLRYATPLPFETFRAERETELELYDTGLRNFEGLVNAIIERIADVLENAGATLDDLSHEIFRPADGAARPAADRKDEAKKSGAAARAQSQFKPRDLEQVLRRLGRCSDLLSRIRDSLGSIGRMLSFFVSAQKNLPPDTAEHLRTLSHDLGPLSDHASFLSQKVSFLLDATLGLINIEQNTIIKVFTIAAVLALPPTLVGTIYGMNFETIPELRWSVGYPFAIMMMLLSAIGPYYYFRRRGWF